MLILRFPRVRGDRYVPGHSHALPFVWFSVLGVKWVSVYGQRALCIEGAVLAIWLCYPSFSHHSKATHRCHLLLVDITSLHREHLLQNG